MSRLFLFLTFSLSLTQAEALVQAGNTTVLCECENDGVPEVTQIGDYHNCYCRCPVVAARPNATFFGGAQCASLSTYCDDAGFFCSNGGVCLGSGQGWSCSCPRPFYGSHCLNEGLDCGTNLVCTNGGVCVSDPTFHPLKLCQCPPGYSGRDCGVFTASSVSQISGSQAAPATEGQEDRTKKTKWYTIFLLALGCCAAILLILGATWLQHRRSIHTSYLPLHHWKQEEEVDPLQKPEVDEPEEDPGEAPAEVQDVISYRRPLVDFQDSKYQEEGSMDNIARSRYHVLTVPKYSPVRSPEVIEAEPIYREGFAAWELGKAPASWRERPDPQHEERVPVWRNSDMEAALSTKS